MYKLIILLINNYLMNNILFNNVIPYAIQHVLYAVTSRDFKGKMFLSRVFSNKNSTIVSNTDS